jgi:Flp pilus assembly protein TadD
MALRRPFLLVAVSLTCFSSVAFAYQRSAAQSHLEHGFSLARSGNLEAAESELRQAATLSPKDAQVLTSLGTVLAMRHKLEESSEIYRSALKIDGEDLTTRRYLAANLWQLHLYPEAKKNLQFILARKPDDKGSRLLLGMVSENAGDYATAARMLGSVPEEVKKEPKSMAALARSYYHVGETEKARTVLNQMSEADASTIFLAGQIADEMTDYVTAERLFKSLEGVSAIHGETQYQLALVAYHAGHFPQCEQILSTLGPKTAAAMNLLGWCYQKQGKKPEARAAIEESIASAPSEMTNYLDQTKILLAQHALPAALQSARRTADKFPQAATALAMQGTVEMEMGQFTDAVGSFAKAKALDASQPDAWLGLARAQSSAGLTTPAEASFAEGIRRFPKNASFKSGYAELLLKKADSGDAKAAVQAEQLLRAALAIEPNLSDAHYQLGNLALKNNQLPEAQQHLEQAAKLAPSNGQIHFALARLYRRLGRTHDADLQMKQYDSLKQAGAR